MPRPWAPVRQLLDAATALSARRAARLPALLRTWNAHLHDVDGEPCCRDWREFRPLRLQREEDWSDWLQHLLSTSRAGRFAGELLGRAPEACIAPKVQRELVVSHRRLDLRVQWEDGTFTHIEVKTGDTAFEKTFETARVHRELIGQECADFILLPRDDLAQWAKTVASEAATCPIEPITWHDVALALRRSLKRGGEPPTWRAWAVAFLGAVHHTLLGHPVVGSPQTLSSAMSLNGLIELMEEALDGA